ncbi:MAG TPA: alpha/beta fold hydrolase [Acidisoma sp.]|uniref:alpha/beta fold hydrolase n=1 Tax=Acidisoma sp. TaxID=1872115 RepID=UPI002B5B0E4C|nr:alpha/beta fold hydrolase [Acidisoma sp.]HTH99636.1 alpha/beta fold hydrolase [Acidisoma sp.]
MTPVEKLGAARRYPSALPVEDRILLVMLPGAGIAADDFADHGFIAAVQGRVPTLDIVALRPDIELYLDGNIAPVLHEGIIVPAVASGIRRIWLLGLSLGGMGALLYSSAYPDLVEGLVLLAPFLGTHGTMAELTRAGRFVDWSAKGSAATAPERQLLTWIQGHLRAGRTTPKLFLGHATRDRFAAGHRLLAAALPASQVVEVDGVHNWAAWTQAWQDILALNPFA